MLPETREETATPATPVSSNTINAIQDAIVGKKHGPLSIFLPGCAFDGVNNVVNDGRRLDFSGAATVYAPLYLPAGTRITTLKWSYLVGAAGSVSMQLIRGKLDASDALNNLTPTAGTVNDSSNAGITELNTITYNHVIEAEYVYFLYFSVTNNASRLYGCGITADRL